MKKRNRWILIILYIMLIAAICACSKSDSGKEILISSEKMSKPEEEKTTSNEKIQVFVCGEVKNPGVYRLNQDDRVVTAIEAAGGLTKDAAYASINQAQKMKDGEQIYIPSKSEQQNTLTEASKKSSSNLISINQASREELMTLPGIGESKADSIIAYRQEHGVFQSTEDLMKISGIKEGVYNKIKDYITL